MLGCPRFVIVYMYMRKMIETIEWGEKKRRRRKKKKKK
jgi:hypothetical protein